MKLKDIIKTKLPVVLLSAMTVLNSSCPIYKQEKPNTIVVDENRFEFEKQKNTNIENVKNKFPLNNILDGMKYYNLPEARGEKLNKDNVVNIRNRNKVSLDLVKKMGEYHANNNPEFKPWAKPTFDSGDIRFTTYYTPTCEEYKDGWDSEHFLKRWLMEGSAICNGQVYGPILPKHLEKVKDNKTPRTLDDFCKSEENCNSEENCKSEEKNDSLKECLNEVLDSDDNLPDNIDEVCSKNLNNEDLNEQYDDCKTKVLTTLEHLNKAKYETRRLNPKDFPLGLTSTFMPRHAKGIIAVNPTPNSQCHIPYGSYVYIGFDEEINEKLSGWYLAADTGGNFPGKCAVDIFVGKGRKDYKKYKLEGKKSAKVWVYPLYETNIR